MSDVTDTVEVGRPRREPQEPQFLDAEQAEELIEQAREQGVELLGENGLLRQMTKAVLERALAEELTDHLGYEAATRPGGVGEQPQRLHPQAAADRGRRGGPGRAAGPQRHLRAADRPQGPAPPGRHRQDRDRPLRPRHDACATSARTCCEIYDVEVSADLISKITDAVLEEVREWQARPLDPVWPVIFLDAIVCKVRDEGTVQEQGRAPGRRASTSTARRRSWASGSSTPRAPSSGCG